MQRRIKEVSTDSVCSGLGIDHGEGDALNLILEVEVTVLRVLMDSVPRFPGFRVQVNRKNPGAEVLVLAS